MLMNETEIIETRERCGRNKLTDESMYRVCTWKQRGDETECRCVSACVCFSKPHDCPLAAGSQEIKQSAETAASND